MVQALLLALIWESQPAGNDKSMSVVTVHDVYNRDRQPFLSCDKLLQKWDVESSQTQQVLQSTIGSPPASTVHFSIKTSSESHRSHGEERSFLVVNH